ncbi:MAG: putative bifunctional diguanylate cyclase/phosphodiesterase [Thiomonas sp.]
MTDVDRFTLDLPLDEVLRHLPSALVVFDAAGQIAQINPACLQLFGLRLHPAELIGQGWSCFFAQIAPRLKEPELERSRIKALIHRDTPDEAVIALQDGRQVLRHYVPLVHQGVVQEGLQVWGALWQLQDVTAVHEQRGRLEYLAERDALTGLLNRRGFDRRLQMLQRHPLGQQGYTLALLDLDDFKRINDTLGHAVGDAVLAETANRLKAVVRLTDMPARIGGDEFAVLMPECRTQEQAVRMAERLLRAMQPPMQIDGAEIRQGCSIGLAVQSGAADPANVDLFQRADLALYDAKAAGRGRFKLYSQRIQQRHDALQQQRDLLRGALDQQRLQLHYQPILTLEPERHGVFVRKFEVLLRLLDEQGRLRRAEEFETALADPQLGIEVDRYVLDAALQQLTEWKRQGRALRLAINVSPHHFSHPDFVGTVRERLAAHPDVQPHDLSLEITEHGPTLSRSVVNATIVELRRLGLSISLDDFGTGNASLSHLQQFDVSVIKIDRSFVRDLLQDGIDLSLSYGMLRLAQLLGISAIAEGVETKQQCRALCLLGFRHVQGYLFAHPMPAEQAVVWLDGHEEALSWLREWMQPQMQGAERAVQAIVTHRMRARKLLSRTLDAEEMQALRDPQATQHCDLGRWLAQQAESCGEEPNYQRLLAAHAEFHQRLCTALDRQDAEADLALSLSSAEVHAAFWEWVLRDTTPRDPGCTSA